MEVFVYKCLYYHPEDEYGHPVYPKIEVVIFYNYDDAKEYQKDFESNPARTLYNTYTVYEGEIIKETIL